MPEEALEPDAALFLVAAMWRAADQLVADHHKRILDETISAELRRFAGALTPDSVAARECGKAIEFWARIDGAATS